MDLSVQDHARLVPWQRDNEPSSEQLDLGTGTKQGNEGLIRGLLTKLVAYTWSGADEDSSCYHHG